MISGRKDNDLLEDSSRKPGVFVGREEG